AIGSRRRTGRAPAEGGRRRDGPRPEGAPAPPRALNPRADRDLEAVCLKCLEHEPGRRYPSAEALAEELERWLRREPVLARRRPWPRRAWGAVRRNWLVTPVAALVGSGLGAAGL